MTVDLAAIAAAFGTALHAAGLHATPQRSSRFVQSVLLAHPAAIGELYWLGRVNFVDHRDDVPAYDHAFHHYFRGIINLIDPETSRATTNSAQAHSSGESPAQGGTAEQSSTQPPPLTTATPGAATDGETGGDEKSLLAAASAMERLTTRDFGQCSPAELALLQRLVEQLPLLPPKRSARRRRRNTRGRQLDLRTTLQRARRTGGEPVEPAFRTRTQRARRVVLLADVSGSMEPYARVYLHLMRGAVKALTKAEAFAFATQLTHLTGALSLPNPDHAYDQVAQATPDWSGGTRIGAAIQEFIDVHGRRGMARGAVIVIVSDGWDTGDPAALGRAMAQLHRLAYAIIWVNPRSAAIGFAPLAGGMAAALPWIDTLVSGHSVQAVEEVLAAIASTNTRHGSTPARSPRRFGNAA